MMRWLKLLAIGTVPVALAVVAFAALAFASPEPGGLNPPRPQEEVVVPSECVAGLQKWVDPEQIILGETTQATLIVTSTCPAERLPVDLIILADESNSMTPKRGGAIEPLPSASPKPSGEPPTPDPSQPPPTKPIPTSPPGVEPTPGGGNERPGAGEPPFCRPGGGITEPPTLPTKPPEPSPGTPGPPPEKTPPGHTDPTPGGGWGDRPDIEDLEPSGPIDWVREEKQWVREFMNLQTVQDDLDSGLLRVGFVSFNKRARVRIPLTSESSRIIGGANRMRGDEVTRINQGLRYAERMLNGSGSRKKEERAKIIVILSDFQFCRRDMRFSSNDVEVVAVGFGVRSADIRNMYQLATKRQYVVDRRNMKQISDIYRYDLALYRPTLLDQLIVRDQLADNMTLVAGSVNPPTVTITGQVIQWQIQQPSDPLTLTYRVEPQEAGVHPISARAEVTWTDTAGLVGNAQFPSASVEVIPPTPTPTPTFTPTPTPTATATSTPTPTPGPRYLPITFKLWPPPTPTMTPLPTPTVCKPSEQIVDVALAIDTSTSMSESTADGKQKLAAAIEAGIELVRLLKSQDQSAVVGFNRVATLASVLTTDKDQAARALLSLPGTQQSGTRIDRGLQESYDEMISPRHRPNASSSIVLVTDGRQMGPIDAVYEIADQIHSRDITLITVGLGTDVDAQLLTDIASRTDDGEPLYFAAPNAEDLLDIYRYIADYIPCK